MRETLFFYAVHVFLCSELYKYCFYYPAPAPAGEYQNNDVPLRRPSNIFCPLCCGHYILLVQAPSICEMNVVHFGTHIISYHVDRLTTKGTGVIVVGYFTRRSPGIRYTVILTPFCWNGPRKRGAQNKSLFDFNEGENTEEGKRNNILQKAILLYIGEVRSRWYKFFLLYFCVFVVYIYTGWGAIDRGSRTMIFVRVLHVLVVFVFCVCFCRTLIRSMRQYLYSVLPRSHAGNLRAVVRRIMYAALWCFTPGIFWFWKAHKHTVEFWIFLPIFPL